MSTPYRWTKQVAGYFGGVRNGMVISWPGRIKDAGGIRNQFHHVIDIVPTILEVTGIGRPRWSTASTRSRSKASAWPIPSTRPMPTPRRRTGPSISRCSASAASTMTAGWRRPCPSARPGTARLRTRRTWSTTPSGNSTTSPRTGPRTTTLPRPIPRSSRNLQDLFWLEAAKYQVLPLDASALTRFIAPRPSIVAGRDEFTYTRPIVGIPLGTAPSILNKSFSITADIEVPEGGGEGMLVDPRRPLRRMGLLSPQGQAGLRLQSPRPGAAEDRGAAGSLAPASTPSSSSSPTTDRASGKAGPWRSRWMVRKWRAAKCPTLCPSRSRSSETFDIGSDTGTGVNDDGLLVTVPVHRRLDKLTLRLGAAG